MQISLVICVHIGLLTYLSIYGFQIDNIVGTAIVALLGAGYSPEQMLARREHIPVYLMFQQVIHLHVSQFRNIFFTSTQDVVIPRDVTKTLLN